MSDLTLAQKALPYAGVPNVIAVEHGVKEGCGERGPTATVRYFVLYADRWLFTKNILGTSFPAGTASIRTIPHVYPPFLGMYALGILEMGGIGKPTRDVYGQLVSTYAYVDVQFGVPPFRFDNGDPSGVPWSATSVQIGEELYPAPLSVYTFPSGSTTTVNPMIPLAIAQISIRRRWMAVYPFIQIAALAGKINNGTFLGIASGYLKFDGGDISEPISDPIGNYVYDVLYRFSWRNRLWNQELDPNGTSGWAIPLDGNSNPKTQSADFTILP